MIHDISDDPILEALRRLSRAEPADRQRARIRARSHAILARNRQRQRASQRDVASRVIDGGFVLVSVAYLTGVVAQALRLFGELR